MGLLSTLIKLLVVVIIIVILGFVIKASVKKGIDKSIDDLTDGVISAVNDLDNVFGDTKALDELIKNQNRYLIQSFSILEVMNMKLDKILKQLTEIHDKFEQMQLEMKFGSFYNTLVALKESIIHFQNTVHSYKYNETVLCIEVKKYVDNYKTMNYEAQIIAFLEVKVLTTKAPIDVLIDVIKGKSAGKLFELQSSTNKLIFDFYADLMVILNTGGTLIISYYELENKIKNGKT